MLEMNLEQEISAFHRLLPSLRAQHRVGWAIVVGSDCRGTFQSFEEAAAFAIREFPAEEFLIRHTDAPMPQVPFVVVDN